MPVSCGIFYLYNQSRTTQNVYNIYESFGNRTQEKPPLFISTLVSIFCKQYPSTLSTYIENVVLFCEMEPALSHWLNVIDILIRLWQLFVYVLKEIFIWCGYKLASFASIECTITNVTVTRKFFGFQAKALEKNCFLF